jgi:hypothetical protein
MIEIFGPHRMRVELETGQVRHPGERRRITRYHLFRAPSGGKLEGDDFDPVRP